MTDPVAPAAAPAADGQGQTAAPATVEWTAGLNPDIAGYVQNKGWKAPTDVIEGYRNLEKYHGVPAEKLLRLPDFNKADKVEMDQFYSKLGRPMDASKYSIDVPEGQSTEMADWARNVFYEAGLTDSQAAKISKQWNEYAGGMKNNMEAGFQERIASEDRALRQEWGQAYDQELGVAKHAAKALGINADKIDALESSLGHAETLKFLNQIGKRLGEDKFVGNGSQGSGFKMTPAAAQAQINALRNDKEFIAKYVAGNAEARAEMNRLHEMLSS